MSSIPKPVRAVAVFYRGGCSVSGSSDNSEKPTIAPYVPVVIIPVETWDAMVEVIRTSTRDLTPEHRERAKAALQAAGVEP